MAPQPLFVIVDGYSMAYRHFYGTKNQELTAPNGEPTGAIYAFTRQILDIMLKDHPRYVAVAWDKGLSGREDIFTDYKANREPPPAGFEVQVERIREMLAVLNVPSLELEGYEADDIIGTMVRQAERNGVYSRIVTGDGDLLQLITDYTDVFLLRPFGGPKIYDRAAFQEKYEQLDPPQLVDLKALMGDSSDNIPGIKGVGQKTALPLIQTYGTLPNLYEHLEDVDNRARKKLDAGRESAFMSYELARIRTELPLNLDLQACVTRDYDINRAVPLFEELGFNSLLRRLRTAEADREANDTPAQMSMFDEPDVAAGEFADVASFAAPTRASELVNTLVVATDNGLAKLVDILNAATWISFDTETTSVDPVEAELVGISLSVDGETGYYIPIGHIDSKIDQLPLETVVEALRGPMTNPSIHKLAHNAPYDVIVLERVGLPVTPVSFDTMIAEWVRDTSSSTLSLTNLAMKGGLIAEHGVLMQDIKDLIGSGKKQITMAAVPIRKAAPYAAEDAAITYRLMEPLKAALDDKAQHILYELEMPLVPVLVAMEQNGVVLDMPYLRAMSQRLEGQLAEIEQAIYANSGGYGEFNINSPKQLNDVLFGKLDLPRQGIRKTVHGHSTAADVLEKLYAETGHPILEKILEHRELGKLKSTYVDALPGLVNEATGRLHTDFNQTGTTTGRVSSSNPNLQNIPIRTEIGREVRRAFITPPGTLLLAVDYSQVELRIMAHIADEPYLKQAFADGQDIHAATAAIVNGVPLEDVSYEQRSFAKRVNFGLLYGMGAFRLSRDSDLTLAEADAFVKRYFERLPAVERYINDTKRKLDEDGYVETLFGRQRHFGSLSNMSRVDRARAEREAVNMPIQGTAADIIKKAMINLYAALTERGSAAKLLLQVHDELVLEVPEDEIEDTAALVVSIMEGAYDLEPGLKANAEIGPNWRDLEPITVG